VRRKPEVAPECERVKCEEEDDEEDEDERELGDSCEGAAGFENGGTADGFLLATATRSSLLKNTSF